MEWRIAINGYGRIGQSILRALYSCSKFKHCQIVAINEPADIETIAHLTKYDTTHGRFACSVDVDGEYLIVNGDRIRVTHSTDLSSLDWPDVDVLLECSGIYSTREEALAHIDAGASRVLFSQPASQDLDRTIVYGVNHEQLVKEDLILSNASCTTNAIVPVLQALDEAFTLECGTLTTIHSAMNDQPTIDAYHNKDLRRTRSAMGNMVPVDTELAKGIERLLPNMADKLTAVAMRVPTINVSAIDLSIVVQHETTAEQVNTMLKAASAQCFSGVMAYTDEPLASSDFLQDPHSCTIDGSQTRVSKGKLIKALVWFDNEWAYANRMLDLCEYLSDKSQTNAG